MAKAMNSQSYAEQSLSRTSSSTVLDSTSNSQPASRLSASLCRLTACSKEISLRRRYPARMFLNSLRQRMGAAQSGSRSNKASAAAVYSPGKYRYASTLESTTITAALRACLRQCHPQGSCAAATPHAVPGRGPSARSAQASLASARPPSTQWPRCSGCVGVSQRLSLSAGKQRRECSSTSKSWASCSHQIATKVVALWHTPLPVVTCALRANTSLNRTLCGSRRLALISFWAKRRLPQIAG